MHSHCYTGRLVSHLFASRPVRSSQPFAGRRATVDAAVPCQVEEDHLEDRGAIACLLEMLGDGRPCCKIDARFRGGTRGLGQAVELSGPLTNNRNLEQEGLVNRKDTLIHRVLICAVSSFGVAGW